MDHPWTDDHSLFISRKLGSPEGVVQVSKCWSLETPIGDDSFSLMGETANPSELNPATAWDQKDYIRLLQFLEVNSAMVNVRGHVIVRSLVKSRRVGRPDGPATYWRCLDLLPMHNFGLVRPVDTHGTPQFLIVGGEVNSTSTTIDAGDWKSKYEDLDAEFKQLKNELDSLKITLGGVNDPLTNCQSENQKLASEIDDVESANKQIQATLKGVEIERDSLKGSLALSDKEVSVCQTENKTLVSEIKVIEVERDSLQATLVVLQDTLTACQSENKKLGSEIEDWESANKQIQATLKDVEVERDSLKASLAVLQDTLTVCQTENKKLVSDIEDWKSANEQMEVRVGDMDVERQKASEEAEKLKIKVSESVTRSFLKESLEKEMDRWALFVASQCLRGSNVDGMDPSHVYTTLSELTGRSIDLSNHHLIRDFPYFGKWKVYRNGYQVTLTCDGVDNKSLRWNRYNISWENKNRSGRLHASVMIIPAFRLHI